MALVVEDGTGKANAESYISVADATTYHADRGNTAWAALATDALREQALRNATEYMVQVYRLRWKGFRMTATQALDWPRSFVYLEPVLTGSNESYPQLVSDVIVPTDVSRQCAQLALRASTGTALIADAGQTVKKEKVGPLEVEYSEYSPSTIRYPSVDAALAPYLKSNGGVQVIRS